MRLRSRPRHCRQPSAAPEAIGRSPGGLTTKLHALCDALGNPVRLHLTPGNWADCPEAPALLAGVRTHHVLADKGYDSGALVREIEAFGARPVIPNKKNAITPRDTDFTLYRERNLVERFFNRLKHYRAIATRYAKRARNYLALVSLAATIIWIK